MGSAGRGSLYPAAFLGATGRCYIIRGVCRFRSVDGSFALGRLRPTWHGRRRPSSGRSDRCRRAEAGWQRSGRGHRSQRGPRLDGTDVVRNWRRHLCDRLGREDLQALWLEWIGPRAASDHRGQGQDRRRRQHPFGFSRIVDGSGRGRRLVRASPALRAPGNEGAARAGHSCGARRSAHPQGDRVRMAQERQGWLCGDVLARTARGRHLQEPRPRQDL